ncbi:uncharacterized protein LOC118750690 [Rhagoletis pomonella]|uniref:uncharacterized protein LOC118750690 n=1 Tax=Rhagoletis pomonella TaxID=28610 RepID=UPI001783EEFE|nr:uncharacterized protein LOC118750690 [Rhagoletis pomonella]
MPEILNTIPPLSLTIENLSETDGIATDRSTTPGSATPSTSGSRRPSLERMTKRNPHQASSAQNKKTRRSIFRRNQKKAPLKVGSPQKCTTAICQKSQIPRALLLTRSSSSASLITNVSRNISAESNAKEDKVESKTLKPVAANAFDVQPPHTTADNLVVAHQYSGSNIFTNIDIVATTSKTPATQVSLQRQYTAAVLNFQIRKSVTQMDLKRTRRDYLKNRQVLASTQSPSISGLSQGSRALMANDNNADIAGVMGASSQSSLVNKIFDQNSYYYVIQDQNSKVAGMRIFATIMLNAWRKRRDEVKRLMEEVNDLKRGSIKAKNQLHVFNTLFRVEQKRNDDLSLQLKRSLDDINNTKSSCESLTTSLISLKADKALLEQQIQIKEQEFDGINAILTQTKSNLFKAMTQQRELQANLSTEQRKVQALEAQKNELINEICEINNKSLWKEEKLRTEMKEKDDAVAMALTKIESLELEISAQRQKTQVLESCLEVEITLRKEVTSLTREVETLQKCLAATLGNRLRTCWNSSVAYQRATLQVLHWIAYCTLPATPPPKITTFPFGLTLEKALSIIRR